MYLFIAYLVSTEDHNRTDGKELNESIRGEWQQFLFIALYPIQV